MSDIESPSKEYDIMLSLSASMLIVSKAGNVSMQAIGALALLELAVAGVAVILGVMGALNVNPSIETAASLSIMLLSLRSWLL